MPNPAVRRVIPVLLSACALALPASCAGDSKDPVKRSPETALRDASLSSRTRARAVEELTALRASGEIDQRTYRELLKKALWARSEAERVRLAAAEALLQDDPDDTRNAFSLLLPTETNFTIIEFVCTTAVERGWVEATPALVRSWSRPVPEPVDAERPERAALLALHPGKSAEEIVFAVFAAPATDRFFGERTRREAWALLTRLDPDGAHIARLVAGSADAPDDPLMADIQAAARDLRAVPLTAEQLEWVVDLRQPEHRAFWDKCRDVVQSFDESRAGSLELYHAAPLLWVSQRHPEWLAESREELLSGCHALLGGRKAHRRTADMPPGAGAAKESLDDWAERLSWADLLTLRVAIAVVDDASVAGPLFQQAADDLRDKSTEHGGVIDAREAGFAALSYPPRPAQRSGDNRFVASPELLKAGATSLFHYHFHAQRHDSSEYAGPGTGDLEYAARFGRACLVFTHLGRDTLGVDYYQPDGARLDLGEIDRP